MGVLLHEVFPAGFGLLLLGWPIYAYGFSIFALRQSLKNNDYTIVLTPSLLVLVPSLPLTLFLLSLGAGGVTGWLIFVAAPLFMSAAAFIRLLTKD
jgi:hypothetical protein